MMPLTSWCLFGRQSKLAPGHELPAPPFPILLLPFNPPCPPPHPSELPLPLSHILQNLPPEPTHHEIPLPFGIVHRGRIRHYDLHPCPPNIPRNLPYFPLLLPLPRVELARPMDPPIPRFVFWAGRPYDMRLLPDEAYHGPGWPRPGRDRRGRRGIP